MALSNPQMGHKSLLQVGREAAFGTPVAATSKFELMSADINPDPSLIRDPSLKDSISRPNSYPGIVIGGGSFTTRGNYNGRALLYDTLLGTSTYGANGGAVSGAGPYKWIFNPKRLLNSLTLQYAGGGQVGAETAGYERYAGTVLRGVTVRIRAARGLEAMMSEEWEIFSSIPSVQTTGLTAALTYAANDPIIFHQGVLASLLIGAAETGFDVRVKEIEVRLRNELADDRDYIGSTTPDIALRNDHFVPRYRITMESHSREQLKKAIAMTAGEVFVKFSNGQAAGALRSILFNSNNCTIEDVSKPVTNYGIVEQTVELEADEATAATGDITLGDAIAVTLETGTGAIGSTPGP